MIKILKILILFSFSFLFLFLITSCVTNSTETSQANIDSSSIDKNSTSSASKKYFECLKQEQALKGNVGDDSFRKCCAELITSECAASPRKGLTFFEILAVIKLHLNEIRKCYDVALKVKNDAKGKMDIAYKIGTNGSVKDVVLERNEMSPAMGECVKRNVAAWIFPKHSAEQGVQVRYPFNFNPI